MEKPVRKVPKEKKEKESLVKRILNSKLMMWSTIIATILTIVGFLLPFIQKHYKSQLSVALNHHNMELLVGQSDTLIPVVKPSDGIFEYIWKSDNEKVAMVSTVGVVRLLEEGSASITLVVKEKNGEIVQASCLYLVRPCDSTGPIPEMEEEPPLVQLGTAQPERKVVTNTPSPEPLAAKPKQTRTTGTMSMGFATYEGGLRDGIPHGNGTMTFRTYHLIPGTVDCNASAGDKVVGTFREGKINMGTWYRSDGTFTMVKLGQKSGK